MGESLEKLAGILLRPEPNAGSHEEAFRGLGFKDPSKASSLWKKLLPTSDPDPLLHEHAASLTLELSKCPDPDMALLNLSRFVDAAISPSNFLYSFLLEKPLCHLLILIFSCSHYLTDILVRNPGYITWLIQRDTLEGLKPYSAYQRELESQSAVFGDHRRRLNSIKRYQRRETLRIGTRDLLGLAPVEEVTAELSFLADAIIDTISRMAFEKETAEAGLDTAAWDVEGSDPFHRFAVLSLGKLGGSELNYSSDIDLLYACEVTEGKHESAFYTALARRITGYLTSPTEEGTLYRADLRLRPDGESGPLVVTLEGHLSYMLRRARPWEKQALLKVRYSAGNIRVADELKANCDQVIFSPIRDCDPLTDVLTMRERALAQLPVGEREGNIKLMPGGIRDTEFIVQALQLIHGQSNPKVRSRNTLEALERLHNYGLLSEEVLKTLSRSYRLYRTVEHRLQMLRYIRTHTLPTGEEELLRLGARVAYSALERLTAKNFRSEMSRSIRRVRKLFDSFFRDHGPGEIPLLLSLPAGEREVEHLLAHYGIREGEQAHRFLSSLVYGDFPNLEGPETLQSAARCLPAILEKISITPDPSLTLRNMVRIIKATGAVRSTLELLAGGGDLMRLILVLASLSTRLTGTISNRIELLDVLAEGTGPGPLPEAIEGQQERLKFLARWYEEILLNIHCQNPIPENGPDVLGPLYSEASEKVVSELFSLSGGRDTPTAVLALGSLGSYECRFGSDLDLVAVIPDDCDPGPASTALRRLADYSRQTGLGHVDMRLRGEGEGSPLVQTLSAYGDYFSHRADFWELLAFTKCRPICGDRGVGETFTDILAEGLRREKLRTNIKENLLAARERLESLSKGIWDIKHAPGGRYDITFILGSYELVGRAALEKPDQSTAAPSRDEQGGAGRFERGLDRLKRDGLVNEKEVKVLSDAHRLYYLVEHAAALHGIAYPPLPERESFLEGYLGRLLGGTAEGNGGFTGSLEDTKRAVRRVFLEYISRLS